MAKTIQAIEVAGLFKTLSGRPVLRGVDMTVPAGRLAAVRGCNGAGKTTLLKCIAGLIRPERGEVRWFGRPAAASAAARRLVGMVSHETALYPQLSLRENLRFAARLGDLSEPCRQADDWLERLGLSSYANCLPLQVSRGMRQRLAVARALIHAPSILLLDEPFSGLDGEGSAWLAALLGQLRGQGGAICLVSHDPEKTRQLADMVYRLDGGRAYRADPAGEAPPSVSLPAARAA
jgi:heme ABC exporter ATP-binding subunit CcmA